jgi:hypothetical protein
VVIQEFLPFKGYIGKNEGFVECRSELDELRALYLNAKFTI